MPPRAKRRAHRPPARKKAGGPLRRRRPAASPRFVGRDPSPVLDHYPPKAPERIARPAPAPAGTAPSPPGPAAPSALSGVTVGTGPAPPEGLIRLERPFDVDEFSQMLGETAIRLTVPRDALAEVLRRATDFMGFGIYVYSITVRPADAELLKGYVVELQRVDYDPETKAWKPFVEKGSVGSGDDA